MPIRRERPKTTRSDRERLAAMVTVAERIRSLPPSAPPKNVSSVTPLLSVNELICVLRIKEKELSCSIHNREDMAIERTSDAIDEVQCAAERELAIRNHDRESTLLRQVVAALIRVNNGTYGTCLDCEAEISLKRLNAVPQTPYCIKCQEAKDRHEAEPDRNVVFGNPLPLPA